LRNRSQIKLFPTNPVYKILYRRRREGVVQILNTVNEIINTKECRQRELNCTRLLKDDCIGNLKRRYGLEEGLRDLSS